MAGNMDASVLLGQVRDALPCSATVPFSLIPSPFPFTLDPAPPHCNLLLTSSYLRVQGLSGGVAVCAATGLLCLREGGSSGDSQVAILARSSQLWLELEERPCIEE